MAVLFCDTECYRNYFLIAFERYDGKRIQFEMRNDDKPLPTQRICKIMRQYTIVTFNGRAYDVPMIYLACTGATCNELKEASDTLILGGVKPWEAGDALDISIPKIDHIDLIETNSSIRQGLKMINGRLHGKRMQDLPYDPDRVLTNSEMDEVKDYCVNADIPATRLLFDACEEPLALRVAMGKKYGADFRSKSDAQMGEAIIKTQVEKALGRRIKYPKGIVERSFKYDIPDFIHYESDDLNDLLNLIERTTFRVGANGKVLKPEALEGYKIKIGNSVYSVGIGGLHSTEAHRSVHSTHNAVLIDADVASQYPFIILKLGLFPKALGKKFLEVYREIVDTRIAAKIAGDKNTSEGLKISINGSFGKLGSAYGVLQAPHAMIAVTLTGQLSILMLVERAERIGIPVVSGNTDGVLFLCPWERQDELKALIARWEKDTAFKMELTKYRAIYNSSVNTYMAVKLDGEVKRKGGILKNPWLTKPGKRPDYYFMLKGNPQMTVISDAVAAFLSDGVPVEKTIMECRDIRCFVTVIRVNGGGTWRGTYLGKVVRYIWSDDGDTIFYKTPNPKTGNYKKVSKSDGCRPVMDLPDEFPDDIDFDRYIEEAYRTLKDIGYEPPPALPVVDQAMLLEAF